LPPPPLAAQHDDKRFRGQHEEDSMNAEQARMEIGGI
jgi:hypothetical protein